VKCRRISGLLSQYVDDALDSRSRKAVEEHVAGCGRCGSELADLRSYLQTMGGLQRIEAPPDFLESVRYRIEQEQEQNQEQEQEQGYGSRFHQFWVRVLSCMHPGSPLKWAGAVAALLVLVITYHGLNINEEMGKESSLAPRVAPLSQPAESGRAERAERAPAEPERPEAPPAMSGAPAHESPHRAAQTAMPAAPSAESRQRVAQRAESAVLSAEPKSSPGMPSAPAVQAVKPIELVLHLKLSLAKKVAGTSSDAAVQSLDDPAASMGEGRAAPRSIAPRSDASRPAPPAFTAKDENPAPRVSQAEAGKAKAGGVPAREATENDSVKEESNETKQSAQSRQAKSLHAKPSPRSREALARIEASIKSIGGTVLNVQYDTTADIPRSITASVPAENFSGLLDELDLMGSLDRPAELPIPSGNAQSVEVKISLLFLQ
jgi:hypothetical protein